MAQKIKNIGKITLAAVLMAAIVISVSVLIRIATAEPVDTYHSGWNLVRTSADEDGATFAAVYDLTGVGTTNGDFASMSDDAFQIPSRNERNSVGYAPGTKWVFAICGKCYNDTDDTFSFDVVGWSKSNGMMHKIVEGDGVLGTQAVVTYPDTGGDALGELVSLTSVAYTHASETFTSTNGFDDVVAGMMARVTGTGFTNEIVNITTVTANDSVVCDITTSTGNGTDATIQINPSFWADTINLDATTKWQGSGTDPNTVSLLNSADNEVALLVLDLAGLEYIQFVLYDCDGETGEEAGDIRVYGRPY